MAMEDLRGAADDDFQKAHAMFQFHSHHLNALNGIAEKAGDIKRLITLYHGANKQLFQRRASDFIGGPEDKSLLPQDLNATLYSVISVAFYPFTVFAQCKEISE